MNNPISKKVVIGFIIAILAVLLVVFVLKFPGYSKYYLTGTDSDKIVKEYDKDKQIELFGDNDAYEMGLNADDRPVFKDKWEALSQLKNDCPEGLKYIKKTRRLGRNLSRFYWEWYATYSNYTYEDADESIQPQLKKIQEFFYVYQNSFKDPVNE